MTRLFSLGSALSLSRIVITTLLTVVSTSFTGANLAGSNFHDRVARNYALIVARDYPEVFERDYKELHARDTKHLLPRDARGIYARDTEDLHMRHLEHLGYLRRRSLNRLLPRVGLVVGTVAGTAAITQSLGVVGAAVNNIVKAGAYQMRRPFLHAAYKAEKEKDHVFPKLKEGAHPDSKRPEDIEPAMKQHPTFQKVAKVLGKIGNAGLTQPDRQAYADDREARAK